MQASILQQDLPQKKESFSSNQVQNSFGAKKGPSDSLFNIDRADQAKFSEIKEESDSKEIVAGMNDLFGVKKDEISQVKINLIGATLDKEKKAQDE